jgi:hypothetical protein
MDNNVVDELRITKKDLQKLIDDIEQVQWVVSIILWIQGACIGALVGKILANYLF